MVRDAQQKRDAFDRAIIESYAKADELFERAHQEMLRQRKVRHSLTGADFVWLRSMNIKW